MFVDRQEGSVFRGAGVVPDERGEGRGMTNYEQIRDMSIEEMARALADGVCSKCVHFVKRPRCEKQCTDGRLRWLKQDVEQ